MFGRRSPHVEIQGSVSKGFEPLQEVFAEHFARGRQIGASCCVYRDGERVVDLWGGIRNTKTARPWEADTMVLIFSATKGLAAMTLALAHSRGLLDYDELVSTYWPEFAQNGKEDITVRQLLAHHAGLFAFDERVDRGVVADLDRLAAVMARQRPAWPPGTRQAYHAITLGFYEGELLRRIDPQHRSLGQFFQDEIATPLGLDVYIRLPKSIPNDTLATLQQSNPVQLVTRMPFRLLLTAMNPRSPISRGLIQPNPGANVVFDDETIYARDLEVPSGGGVGSARGIARAYSAFATGGAELGLRPETLRALMAPAIASTHGFYDEAVKADVQFSLGFFKPSPPKPFGLPGAFGSPGAGGSNAFADPERGIAYAYVHNRMGGVLQDARDIALREALDSVISRAVVPVDTRSAAPAEHT